jgi:hypothetical protein
VKKLIYPLCILMLSVHSCKEPVSVSSVVVAEMDYGRNDYIPLAVGNAWEYSNHESLQTTASGNTTWNRSWKQAWNVISSTKLHDTVEVFFVEVRTVGTDIGGLSIRELDTMKITRTTVTLRSSNNFNLERSGVDSILTVFSNSSCCSPTQTRYKKGVGKIGSDWRSSSHITAGNSSSSTGYSTLVKYTLNPENYGFFRETACIPHQTYIYGFTSIC